MRYTVYRHGKPAYQRRNRQESVLEAIATMLLIGAAVVLPLFL